MQSSGGLYHCPICVQNFHSEKGLYRHIASRKHQKRHLDYERYMAWKNAISPTKLTLLPSFVIDALIEDLHLSSDTHKEDFFTNVDLVDVQEFDRSLYSRIQQPYPYQHPHYSIQQQRQQNFINLNTRRFLQPIPVARTTYGTAISSIYSPNQLGRRVQTPYIYQSGNRSRSSLHGTQ